MYDWLLLLLFIFFFFLNIQLLQTAKNWNSLNTSFNN